MDDFFKDAFTTAIKSFFNDIEDISLTQEGTHTYTFQITRSAPIKQNEIDTVLTTLKEELHKNGHFNEGIFLKTLSGIHQEKDDTSTITRISLAYCKDENERNAYLQKEEEAKNRDHRKIGEEMGLWTFSKLVGAGLPLFTPRGTAIRNALLERLVSIGKEYGMQPVSIPHIAKRDLYDVSGHSEKFGNELLKVIGHFEEFVMKPVNCPHHTQIYASQPRSYRDLPIRYMETTSQYRDEQPGELMGMSRVRAITLDDGHIFCRAEQVKDEVKNIAKIVETFYSRLGLWGKHWVSLSVRDPNNLDGYIGKNDGWEDAEKALQEVSDDLNLNAKRCEGEAAIYGPKIDYQFRDSLGREWQLGTIQVDFALPERFGLSYTNEEGKKETPVMIHRAILGSYERFLGLVLEHFSGWLPLWLSPTQIEILPVGEKHSSYAQDIYKALNEKGFRVALSRSDMSLGKRIKKTKLDRTTLLIVVGDTEVSEKTIEIQDNKEGSTVFKGDLSGAIQYIEKEID